MENNNLTAFLANDAYLKELNTNELIEINGGVPGWLTSFAYDVAWTAGFIIRAGYEMGKAAQGNPHI